MIDEHAAELHELLMVAVRDKMSDWIESGHGDAESIVSLMTGLAGAVAETMATLAKTFSTDDKAGRERFNARLRKMVRRMLDEIQIEPQAQTNFTHLVVENRGDNEPCIFRTLH